jgi:hypothetical protein
MNSVLSGAFVMDNDDNTVFDNICDDVAELACNLSTVEVCGSTTNLPGILVADTILYPMNLWILVLLKLMMTIWIWQ